VSRLSSRPGRLLSSGRAATGPPGWGTLSANAQSYLVPFFGLCIFRGLCSSNELAQHARKLAILPLSPEAAGTLCKRLDEVSRNYKGQNGELENAIGTMDLGRLFGWNILALIHNKRTIRQYEEILDFDVREELPEEGPTPTSRSGQSSSRRWGRFGRGLVATSRFQSGKHLIHSKRSSIALSHVGRRTLR